MFKLPWFFPAQSSEQHTRRWGGLQLFMVYGLLEVGLFNDARPVFGMVGLRGRSNRHTDVWVEYMVGKITGMVSDVENVLAGSLKLSWSWEERLPMRDVAEHVRRVNQMTMAD